MRRIDDKDKDHVVPLLGAIIQLTRLGRIPWEEAVTSAFLADYNAMLEVAGSPVCDILRLVSQSEKDGGPKLVVCSRVMERHDETPVRRIVEIIGHPEIYKLFQLVREQRRPKTDFAVILEAEPPLTLEVLSLELMERLETFREQK